MSNLYDDLAMQHRKWPILVVLFGGLLLVAIFIFSQGRSINTFQECKDAGQPILESYPEQCIFQGRTYTNTDVDQDKLIRP
jgi:hypothetical protein